MTSCVASQGSRESWGWRRESVGFVDCSASSGCSSSSSTSGHSSSPSSSLVSDSSTSGISYCSYSSCFSISFAASVSSTACITARLNLACSGSPMPAQLRESSSQNPQPTKITFFFFDGDTGGVSATILGSSSGVSVSLFSISVLPVT